MGSQSPKYPGFGYPGYVYVDEREEWIRAHNFASRQWMVSHVKYDQWEYRSDGSFEIVFKELLPTKVLTIVLYCRHYPNGGPHCRFPDYVHVFHSHVKNSKPR
jgi:hypothetical protein